MVYVVRKYSLLKHCVVAEKACFWIRPAGEVCGARSRSRRQPHSCVQTQCGQHLRCHCPGLSTYWHQQQVRCCALRIFISAVGCTDRRQQRDASCTGGQPAPLQGATHRALLCAGCAGLCNRCVRCITPPQCPPAVCCVVSCPGPAA